MTDPTNTQRPTQIVWLSRHVPTVRQQQELQRLFPHHILRVDTRTFSGVDDIVNRFHKLGGDEMVVVAPLTVIRELTKRGIYPLRAEMALVNPSSPLAEVWVKGRAYRFVRFQRITAVNLELVDIHPPTPHHKPGPDHDALPPTNDNDGHNKKGAA